VHPEITRIHLNFCRQAGYSLLELVIVVVIIGVLALVATPDFSSSDATRLETAARLYAEAIRYARSESLRGGKLYAFKQKSSPRFIVVKSVDQTTTPWSLVKDVYHPVSRKLYKIELDNIAGMDGITTTRTPVYRGSCNTQRRVYFDHQGRAFCLDPETVALISFEVVFTLNGQKRSVLLDGQTGRVTIR